SPSGIVGALALVSPAVCRESPRSAGADCWQSRGVPLTPVDRDRGARMPKPTRTDALTFIAVGAGVVAAVAFALGSTSLGGAALAATAVVLALLVRGIARRIDARHGELRSAIGKNA